MTIQHESTRPTGPWVHRTTIDTAQPLTRLTTVLSALCDRAEDSEPTTLHLELAASTPHLPSWPGTSRVQDVTRWEQILQRLQQLPTTNIATARGTSGGATLDLLMAADYRVITPDLHLHLPHHHGHFWPGMSIHRLVHHLGLARARRLVLWTRDLTATQAMQYDLADEVTPDPDGVVGALHTHHNDHTQHALRRHLLIEASTTTHHEALTTHVTACAQQLRRQTTDTHD